MCVERVAVGKTLPVWRTPVLHAAYEVHNKYPSVLFSARGHDPFAPFTSLFSSYSFLPLVRPVWLVIGGWLFACGIADFVMMGADKARAVDGRWRYRESTLLLWAFLGGFWGLLFGAAVFHHKTRKHAFIAVATSQLSSGWRSCRDGPLIRAAVTAAWRACLHSS